MLDRNVRMALLNLVVAQLRASGASDEIIRDVIKAAGGVPEGEYETERRAGSLREKAKEFSQKYLKPEAQL